MACVAARPDEKKIIPAASALRLSISGIVQGVGFRPFVFKLAHLHDLVGQVTNTTAGVEIIAAGSAANLRAFTRNLTRHQPSAASIDLVQSEELPTHSLAFTGFTIKTSAQTGIRTALVTPDLDICPECLHELFDPANRRFHYPFINCTNCGPRYTLIRELPYDRPATSMNTFKLCPACRNEYDDPANRRFHAQPNACADCGPRLTLVTPAGQILTGDPVQKTQQLLGEGKIIAIKGIGGFHLAVDAANQAAVATLRKRKGRPDKPLAVMAATSADLARFAEITPAERLILESRIKPVVLLDKKEPFPLATNLAPQIKTIGAMLPYAPLHHLLLHEAPFTALVMTSGNLSAEPIAIDNHEALTRLAAIADFFLLHDRPILTSNDDSVVQVVGDQPIWLRRSRSLAPAPRRLNYDAGLTLAVGGALKNTVCLTRNQHYFVSQHIGDLGQFESLNHFKAVIEHLQQLLRINPTLMVHDLHPDYPSTSYATQSSLPTVAVQHHHAHAVACMAEHNLTAPTIAVVLDGTGYGPDETIWGGEILLATYEEFTRAAHFTKIPLPGGEQAIRNPWRSALAYLHAIFGQRLFELELGLVQRHLAQAPTLVQMIEQGINSPLTSSCGRLFDCVAALLGLRDTITFEGQAAMELEAIATSAPLKPYPFEIKARPPQPLEISFAPTIQAILTEIKAGTDPQRISSRFHRTMAKAVTETCVKIRDRFGIQEVVLSGGVFQNRLLLAMLRDKLRQHAFSVFCHQELPTNDGGLALGQAVAGRAIYLQRSC